MTKRPRVTVDPNSFSKYHPDWTAVLFRNATWVPEVGAQVVAVQDEPDGPDYVSTATVKQVDAASELIYVEVDWAAFADEVPVQVDAKAGNFQVEFAVARAGAEASSPWRQRLGLNGVLGTPQLAGSPASR
ncbi:hypothetical protein [Clavibacter nebraskensis]|uniref:hypothetical protein n=1 Tax=Clavibacter nebraskensis TaxID=31963 RepID=UPI00200E2D7D|nr:hypothetical protein [Clavibacter nebraskensis]UQB14599.1 hypothetical protein LIX20_001221 [Clavibacter nebraskensis]UQB17431.1 hypothetical protein LIX22_001220 [Clavibacter nebraskensis]